MPIMKKQPTIIAARPENVLNETEQLQDIFDINKFENSVMLNQL